MHNKEFDELFRNKLLSHSSQVPGDMWQRILPKKDKDHKLFIFWRWYYIVPALLLLCLAGGYVIFSQATSSVKTDMPLEKEITDAHNNHNGSPNNKPVPFNSTKIIPGDKIIVQTDRKKNKTGKKPVHTRFKQSSTAFADNQPGMITAESQQNVNDAEQVPEANKPDIKDSTKESADTLSSNQVPTSEKTSGTLKKPCRLEVYVSPDIPFIKTYSGYRSTQLSYTIGARISKSFGNHFYVSAGLQYSRINLKTERDSLVRLFSNHYNRIDIAVLLGYETGGEHFKVAVNVGMIYNIYSWRKETGLSYPLKANKPNSGISLYAGFNFANKINDRLSLFAEPYYRYQLSNSGNNSSVKINTPGLLLGARYHFKKARQHL